MVDYDTPTGTTGGFLRITDNGTNTIIFKLKSGNTLAWANNHPYRWFVNNVHSGNSYKFTYPAGGAILNLITFTNVTTAQTVWFEIDATGSTGLGGPTRATQYITRGSVPSAPTSVSALVSNEQGTQFLVSWGSPSSNGGHSITKYAVRYGTSSSLSGNGTETTSMYMYQAAGQGSTMYAQVRAYNSLGWGAWSNVVGVIMRNVPSMVATPTLEVLGDEAAQIKATWFEPPHNGAPILDYAIRYSTTGAPTGNGTTTSSREFTFNSVSGATYYVQVRARNTVGPGAWSPIAIVVARARPGPPSGAVSLFAYTGMRYVITDGNNNGAIITSREYRFGKTNDLTSATVHIAPSNRIVDLNDLEPGTTYFWQSRVKSAQGDSDWGPIVSGMTLSGAMIKVNGVWVAAVPYIKDAGVWKIAYPYVKEDGEWKETIF